jgi:F0F1-type ATP synthase membrane subunit b/b'
MRDDDETGDEIATIERQVAELRALIAQAEQKLAALRRKSSDCANDR